MDEENKKSKKRERNDGDDGDDDNDASDKKRLSDEKKNKATKEEMKELEVLFKDVNGEDNDPELQKVKDKLQEDLLPVRRKENREAHFTDLPRDIMQSILKQLETSSILDLINFCKTSKEVNANCYRIFKVLSPEKKTTNLIIKIRQAAPTPIPDLARLELTRDVVCNIQIVWYDLMNLYNALKKIFTAYDTLANNVFNITYRMGQCIDERKFPSPPWPPSAYSRNNKPMADVHTFVSLSDPFDFTYPPAFDINTFNAGIKTVDGLFNSMQIQTHGFQPFQQICMNFICTYPMSPSFLQITQIGMDNVLDQTTDYDRNPNQPIREHITGLEFNRNWIWDLAVDGDKSQHDLENIVRIPYQRRQHGLGSEKAQSQKRRKSSSKEKSPKKKSPKKKSATKKKRTNSKKKTQPVVFFK